MERVGLAFNEKWWCVSKSRVKVKRIPLAALDLDQGENVKVQLGPDLLLLDTSWKRVQCTTKPLLLRRFSQSRGKDILCPFNGYPGFYAHGKNLGSGKLKGNEIHD